MSVEERETLAIVEFSVKIDGLDLSVKAVEETKKLSEDTAGGVTVNETAHLQSVSLLFTRAYSVV
ncbi:hypothetical protein C444_09832 [Haloarcula japonica DSM 6131]|uniref:Uncharacterized protein n=1 Tax=Haloarcula japonica (strain ATCC 49778 / DSM 6131 / JCM 7785 / NBRC 101032 / NCIMB 13157 / TR-1) TaxID=1227453 RepID=M0LBI6_HALJT|nr:hypothetical protein C444_09832 [Haloarcula japonica DSM 6131]